MLRTLTILAGFAILLTATGSTAPATAASYAEGEIVVELNPGFTIEGVNERWGTTTIDVFEEAELYLVYKPDTPDLEAFALQMMTDPAILEAEVNYFEDTPEGIRQMVIVAVGGEMVDYEDQEIAERIGLPQAHEKSTGFGVTVGVLDSGVDPDHIALRDQLVPGYDFVDHDSEPWEESNGIDDDQDGLTDDGFGHGTMVAGIIALVAPHAQIMPIRVLDDEGRSDAWTVARAIRYAVDQGAHVINMSFGVPRTISTIGHEITYARYHGIHMVAGAGNENTDDHVYYPGGDSKVMLITALDSLDIKADFADWKSKVLVSAPGTGVRSSYPGGEWGLGAGCSFATPFVTGEVALILSHAPNMTADDMEERVEYAVQPIYHIPQNGPYDGKLGSGRIYLPRALQNYTSAAPLRPGAGQPHPPRNGVGPRLMGSLAVAFPNPARGAVSFQLPEAGLREARGAGTPGSIDASIFDARGRLIQSLVAPSGTTIGWDGTLPSGQRAPAGSYFAILRQDGRAYRVPVRLLR